MHKCNLILSQTKKKPSGKIYLFHAMMIFDDFVMCKSKQNSSSQKRKEKKTYIRSNSGQVVSFFVRTCPFHYLKHLKRLKFYFAFFFNSSGYTIATLFLPFLFHMTFKDLCILCA